MSYAPEKEKSHCQHGQTTIDTLGVPEVIAKVVVPLPEAEIRGHL